MDAFSGYNQIRIKETNQEKTSFVTSQGLFCYKVMPFGLKNVGATYQRLMNKMFAHQIGRNVQVYVDDMLVKSIREDYHLNDLQETFDMLRTYNMKLNPSKCAFGVTVGKFLGFMVKRYRGQSRESTGYNGACPTKDGQRGVKLEWQDNSIIQVYLTSNGQMPPLFPHIEEVI